MWEFDKFEITSEIGETQYGNQDSQTCKEIIYPITHNEWTICHWYNWNTDIS